MASDRASASSPLGQNRSSIFASISCEESGTRRCQSQNLGSGREDCSSRSLSVSSRHRYQEAVLGSSISFESIPPASARCQSQKERRSQQSRQQNIAADPGIFPRSNCSSRANSHSNCSSRASSVEPSPRSSFRRSHEELQWRSDRTERNGMLANFLFGRPHHAFGSDALPRNARGTTGFSRGRAPPGGPSVLGSAHFHSPLFPNQSHRPQCASGARRWEEISLNGVDVAVDLLNNSDIASAPSTPRQRPSASPGRQKSPDIDSISKTTVSLSPKSRPPAGQRVGRPFPFHDELVGKRFMRGSSGAANRARYHQAMFCSAELFPTAVQEINKSAPAQTSEVCKSPSVQASASNLEVVSASLELDTSVPRTTKEVAIQSQEQLFLASAPEWHVPERRRDAKCPVRAALGTVLAQSKAHHRIHPTEPLPKKTYRKDTARTPVRDLSKPKNEHKRRSTESNASTCCSTPQLTAGRSANAIPARSRSSSVASQRSNGSAKPVWR